MNLIEPLDEHNLALLANVRPPDWINPEPAQRYNLVVVGAGAAGLISAAGAAGLGAKVALVEKHLLGGDCLNVGCVPSKALLRSAHALAQARALSSLGCRLSGEASADFPQVMERMRRLRRQISANDSAARYRSLGADVFIGEGRFVSPAAVEVAGKTLNFSKVIIATGARALIPPIPGLAEAGALTNETVFWLTELPRRLAVIGAGPIGCELSQAFACLGSQVTLLQSAPQILEREDPDAAKLVEKALQENGVFLISGCKILSVEKRGKDKIIKLQSAGKTQELSVDEILVGVGRAPNVEGLGLETAGIAYDRLAGVTVNDFLQTTNPRVYAAGDICLKTKFTHMSDAAARIALQNALFMGRKRLSSLIIPWVTYTDPEIAHVGLYEKDAAVRGVLVETFIQEFKDVDRAILDGETQGFVKVHVRKGTDKILGATIVARHAGEMIGELTLAMTAGVGLKAISQTIHSYPTQAEAIKKAADAYSRSRLTPGVKKILRAWLNWSR